MEHLNEKFIIPMGLHEIDQIDGDSLFGSDKLDNQFIEIMNSQIITKPVSEKISELVKNKVIVPCYMKKGLARLIVNKIFSRDKYKKSIRGFFYQEQNRIYCPLDNSTSYLLWTDDKDIGEIVIHELQHYCAVNMKKKFFNIHFKSLVKYYSTFFGYYLFLDENPVNLANLPAIQNIIQTLVSNELGTDKKLSILIKSFQLLKKTLPHEIKSKSTDSYINELCNAILLFNKNPARYIELLHKNNEVLIDIAKALYRGYIVGLKLQDINTVPIQELLYPSEVISVESMYKPNVNHYKCILDI